MQNIFLGISLLLLGIVVTLTGLSVIELNIVLNTLLNSTVALIGLLLILREQGRRAALSAEAKTKKTERVNSRKELERSEAAHREEENYLRNKSAEHHKRADTAEQALDDLVGVNEKDPRDK